MTLEQLLNADSATLRSLTDADLLKHFAQYLPVTRPELAPRPKHRDEFDPRAAENRLRQQKLQALLGDDIDVKGLMRRQGKRK